MVAAPPPPEIVMARILGAVMQCSPSDPAAATEAMVREVACALDCENGFAVISFRSDPDSDDPVDGWRPMVVEERGPAHHSERWVEYEAAGHHMNDPTIHALLADVGKHRVLLQVAADEPPITVAGLLHELDIRERLVAVHAYSEHVELSLGVDRRSEQEPFTDAELAFLQAVVEAIGPVVGRIAMSVGIHEGRSELPPRYKETLGQLLSGRSEKEMAAHMDLAASTVHQYVVAVYRHFGVRSRAELMALWL